MSDNRTPLRADNTLHASRSVLNLLPKMAGLAVGASGLAYIAGWCEAFLYYKTLGAPWAASLLSTSQIMQTSAWLFSLILVTSFIAVITLDMNKVNRIALIKCALIFLALAYSLIILALALKNHVSYPALGIVSGLSSISLGIAAGLGIGALIAHLTYDKLVWSFRHLIQLGTILSLSLLSAPGFMGMTRANISADIYSSPLPRVNAIALEESKEWRLVGLYGDKFLLVSLAKEPKDRLFKLVSAESVEEIYPPKSH